MFLVFTSFEQFKKVLPEALIHVYIVQLDVFLNQVNVSFIYKPEL